jgi:NAD-dependent DNA ligase
MPNVPYTWNETGVDIILENPEDNQIVKEKNITGFFRCIGVEGLSNGIISRLMNFGYDSVSSILRMTVADYLKVDGFKTTLANKIHNGIADKVSKASLVTLMTASNKFGHGFSEKKMELILNELPDILISKETDEEKITAIEDIKGMGRKTAEAFVAKIGDFITFLKECDLEDRLYVEPDEEDSIEENEFNGKTIVLTGTREKTIIEYLKQSGAKQGTSVSKNTYMVIAKNKNDDTGKAEDARKLSIPILSVEEFIEKYVK